MKILAADLVRYNANTRGTNTGDCTARAISLAFGMDYSKARKVLNDTAKEEGNFKYNTHVNCIDTIKKLGGGDIIDPVKLITVDEFADTHMGTYILFCSRDGSKFSHSNHLVCVIDGKVYDSWDSRKNYVMGYWEIESGTRSNDITDVGTYIHEWLTSKTADEWFEYMKGVFYDIIHKNRKLQKLEMDYRVKPEFGLGVSKFGINGYTLNFKYTVYLMLPDFGIKQKGFDGKFSIVFKPTMSTDDVEPYFEKTFYNKMYTFIQGVVREVEDIYDSSSVLTDDDYQSNRVYIPDDYSKRSFRSLPYWVQKLALGFRIYKSSYINPDDRVRIVMRPLSYDKYATNNEVVLYAPSMDYLKLALEHYKNTGNSEEARDIAVEGQNSWYAV